MKHFIYLVLLILAVSCQTINKNPEEGADTLFKELKTLSSTHDYKTADKRMSEYWDVYTNTDKATFILALRDNLNTDNEITAFLTDADFHKYPNFGTYIKYMEDTAIQEAINDPTVGSSACKGILFGSLIAEYADNYNIDEACQMMEMVTKKLRSSPEWARIEFFAAFKKFIQTSGEPGVKAFNFLNEIECPVYTDFQRMALESLIDYN